MGLIHEQLYGSPFKMRLSKEIQVDLRTTSQQQSHFHSACRGCTFNSIYKPNAFDPIGVVSTWNDHSHVLGDRSFENITT